MEETKRRNVQDQAMLTLVNSRNSVAWQAGERVRGRGRGRRRGRGMYCGGRGRGRNAEENS